MTFYFGGGYKSDSDPGTAFNDAYKQSRLARLLSDAYQAPEEGRQGLLAQMMQVDPRSGMEAAKYLDPRLRADGDPAGMREFNALTQGMTKDDVLKARRVRLGLDPRQSSAAIGYQKIIGPDGREVLVALDPRAVGAQVVGGGPSYGSGVGVPQMQQSLPPAASDMEADIALANQLAQAGFDPDKIDAFLAARGQRADSPVPAQNPFASPSLQEKAFATESGQQQAKISTLPLVGQLEAQNAGMREAATQDAQLAVLPRRGEIEAGNAGVRESAVVSARADAERAADAPKRAAKYAQALSTAANVKTSIGKALNLTGKLSTGFMGARLRGVEGTPAYDLAREIETIKANLGFDRLQEMRDNSPTGGALGQVAIQELVALQSTVANLDPNQSEAQIKANLERIRNHYNRWEGAIRQAQGAERAAPRSTQQPGRVRRYNPATGRLE